MTNVNLRPTSGRHQREEKCPERGRVTQRETRVLPLALAEHEPPLCVGGLPRIARESHPVGPVGVPAFRGLDPQGCAPLRPGLWNVAPSVLSTAQCALAQPRPATPSRPKLVKTGFLSRSFTHAGA